MSGYFFALRSTDCSYLSVTPIHYPCVSFHLARVGGSAHSLTAVDGTTLLRAYRAEAGWDNIIFRPDGFR